MDSRALEPWMLRTDWRQDNRPWLLVDLATWPADQSFDPRPPVPLLGVGPTSHPQAAGLDVVVEPGFSLESLAAGIEQAPLAAATLVQLLRAIEGLAPDSALTLESATFAMLQAGPEHAAWQRGRPAGIPAAAGQVRVDRHGDILEVVLDRPEALNAIDTTLRDGLFDAFFLAALDDEIRTVRLTGAGRCFSIGADLAEFGAVGDPVTAHAIRTRALPARQLVRRPGIYTAHVHGACVGAGLELAAFATRLTASPSAWFQLPETGMGILPGFGGCVSIPRRIGRQRAAMLMLSGRRVNAATALRLGLIDEIMDDPALDERRADEIGR